MVGLEGAQGLFPLRSDLRKIPIMRGLRNTT
jgi:hypothetical protein